MKIYGIRDGLLTPSETELVYFARKFLSKIGENCALQIVYDRTLFPEYRDIAYTDGETIFMSDKIFDLSRENMIALLAHEIAHIYFMQRGIEHSEDEADEMAELLFGSKIYYDEFDIQTIDPRNTKPFRPEYLPQ